MRCIVALLLFLLLLSESSLKASQVNGEGFFCVGAQGSGEDLFYGIIFFEGNVEMLSFKRNDFGGNHVNLPKDRKDVAYTWMAPDTAQWQSGSYMHTLNRRFMKHTVDGGKKGFFRGLCFVEIPGDIKMRLWEKVGLVD